MANKKENSKEKMYDACGGMKPDFEPLVKEKTNKKPATKKTAEPKRTSGKKSGK